MRETRQGTVESRERRFNPGLELRAATNGSNSPGTLVGYAAPFNSLSDVLTDDSGRRRFRERIMPGAFAASLRQQDLIALRSHDDDNLLGRVSAGTLRAVEDERGLHTEIDLPDTTVGRDTAVSVARRDLQGMSFGFIATRERWDLQTTPPTRDILEAQIYEVTVTANPAYPDTTVALRSLDKALQAPGAVVPDETCDADPTVGLPAARDTEDLPTGATEGDEGEEAPAPSPTVEILRLQLDLLKASF